MENKQIVSVVVLLITLISCFVVAGQQRDIGPFQTLAPAPVATSCVYSSWYFDEVRELSLAWQKHLALQGIQAIDPRVVVTGETISCMTDDGQYLGDVARTFLEEFLEVKIEVTSISDDSILGEGVLLILGAWEAMDNSPNATPPSEYDIGRIHIIFVANEERREFDLYREYASEIRAQRLTPDEFFATLDGRRIQPTLTPENGC